MEITDERNIGDIKMFKNLLSMVLKRFLVLSFYPGRWDRDWNKTQSKINGKILLEIKMLSSIL